MFVLYLGRNILDYLLVEIINSDDDDDDDDEDDDDDDDDDDHDWNTFPKNKNVPYYNNTVSV